MAYVGKGQPGQVLTANVTTGLSKWLAIGSQSGLTSHGVVISEGTGAFVATSPGSNGQILQSKGAAADPAYTTATYPATTTINDILYSSSTNVVGQITAGNDGVLISSNTGVPSWLANGTTGQVLTATTGSPPSWANAAGGSITWHNAFIGTTTMVVNNGYLSQAGATLAFPAGPSLGNMLYIVANANDPPGNASPTTFLGAATVHIGVFSGAANTMSILGAGSLTLVYDAVDGGWFTVDVTGGWTIG